MYRNILVPVDGSKTGGCGLEEAIRLARAVGARIRLLHIVNKTPWLAAGAAPGTLEDLMAHFRSVGESVLHDAKAAVRSAGIEVEDRLVESLGDRAGEVIISEAREWPAELIVCGTHGRRGLKRIVMGSDAEFVVRHTPVPVLLIRARE